MKGRGFINQGSGLCCRFQPCRLRAHESENKFRIWGLGFTLPETNMETQKGPYKDYSPFKKGAIWVSMLIWGSVGLKNHRVRGNSTEALRKL